MASEEEIKNLLEEKIVNNLIRGNNLPEEEKKEFKSHMKEKHKIDEELAEDILNYKLFIKETPEKIGEGLNQLVIQLNEDIAVKLHKTVKINDYINVDNHSAYGRISYNVLKELNFPITESEFYKLNEGTYEINKSEKNGTFFIITENLKKNGTHEVSDFDYEILNEIENGLSIKAQFIIHKKVLQDMINNKHPLYNLKFNSHVQKEGNNEEAIRHVFLIQKNKKTGMGKLYAGDFDHLSFYNK